MQADSSISSSPHQFTPMHTRMARVNEERIGKTKLQVCREKAKANESKQGLSSTYLSISDEKIELLNGYNSDLPSVHFNGLPAKDRAPILTPSFRFTRLLLLRKAKKKNQFPL